ncbi:MAG: deoxyguanosinetriphosphate triphosphohydrolase, partial [Verrucomicrobiota bacterium]
EAQVLEAGVRSADDVRTHRRALVQYSPERRLENLELRKYLYRNLYYHPVVAEPNHRAVRMLGELFHYYLQHPNELGATARRNIPQTGLERGVCDYLASMTDRFCVEEHHRLFGLYIGGFRPV